LLGPVYRRPLVVFRRAYSEAQGGSVGNELCRKEIASPQLVTISRDAIDLIGCVARSYLPPLARVPGRRQVHADGVLYQRRPLALHPENAMPQIEGEVVTPVLRDRLQHIDAELDRL